MGNAFRFPLNGIVNINDRLLFIRPGLSDIGTQSYRNGSFVTVTKIKRAIKRGEIHKSLLSTTLIPAEIAGRKKIITGS